MNLILLHMVVPAVEALERWMRSRTAPPGTRYVRVHTGSGDVLLKVRAR